MIVQGPSSEHEYLIAAKKLCWAEEIDGEILINDSDLETPLTYGKCYRAKVEELAGDKLVAKVIDTA